MARRSMTELMAQKGQKPIVMVTAYDAAGARLVDAAVDSILVGDSLGMVVQGHDTTIPVTLDEMVYHTRMVSRGSQHALVIADLPFATYNASVADAVHAASRCMKEGLCQAVKLEGGIPVAEHIRALTSYGVPVVGHVGLTPQHIHAFGGWGKRGKSDAAAKALMEDAKAVEEAGASLVVLENIPHDLAGEVTAALRIPTIGIGAGPKCDGQVQVFHDLFGLNPDFTPRHAKRYTECGKEIQDAVGRYAEEVLSGTFVSR